MTLGIKISGKTTVSIMTLRIVTISIMTFERTIIAIITFILKALMTFGIDTWNKDIRQNNNQHNDTQNSDSHIMTFK
jgi:hypothetical protein